MRAYKRRITGVQAGSRGAREPDRVLKQAVAGWGIGCNPSWVEAGTSFTRASRATAENNGQAEAPITTQWLVLRHCEIHRSRGGRCPTQARISRAASCRKRADERGVGLIP